MLRFRLESAQSESDSVTPHTDTAITDIRDMDMVITHAAITAITVVGIHITERITTVGGPTTAIDTTTSITSVITTATKSHRLVRSIGWLGEIPSQFFFSLSASYSTDSSRRLRKNSCKIAAHSFRKTPDVISHR